MREEGYAYIYLSNESPTQIDIYFDDVTVTHTKSRVIQYNEYYPLGLQTASSWTRENTTGNNFLYNQGNELNPASGWYETFYRSYDASLGRFLQVDPKSTQFAEFSAYHYAGNNPVLLNDPNGAEYQIPYEEHETVDDIIFETGDEGGDGWGDGTIEGDGFGPPSGPWGHGFNNFPNSIYGSSRGRTGPGSGNNWSDSYFSNPTRDHFIMSSAAFESKYGISDHEYHRSLIAQRAAEPYTGSMWDYGWAGGSRNEYHFVNGVAVGMTSYNIYEGGGGFENHYSFENSPSLNKDNFSSFEKVLVAINEWNPIASGWDAISGYVTGKDRFGDPITSGEATWKAAGIIPFGKVLKVGKFVVRSNAVTHIFRNAVGHVNPTTATSQLRYLNLFSNVASNPANLVKTANAAAANAGVQMFMQTFNKGTVWVQVRDGVIFNAGVNLIP